MHVNSGIFLVQIFTTKKEYRDLIHKWIYCSLSHYADQKCIFQKKKRNKKTYVHMPMNTIITADK